MLKLTVKLGEYLLIGNEVKVVFAGGSANNLRILVDAPRSSALEKKMMETEPGNFVTHYKERELSKEAQQKIRAVLMEERRRARAEKRA